MKMKRWLWCPGLCGVTLLAALLPGICQAEPYTFGFSRITNNSTVDVAGQFSVEVSPYGTDKVLFTFRNTAVAEHDANGSIHAVYFEDGSIISPLEVVYGESYTNKEQVEFVPLTDSEKALPGGTLLDPDFMTTAGYMAKFDTGDGKVDVGESLAVAFMLATEDTSFSDVIAAINKGFSMTEADRGTTLRIGIHVGSLPPWEGNEFVESDSFILVPLPGAVLLGLFGLSASGLGIRRMTE